MNPFEIARWNPFADPFFRTGLSRRWPTPEDAEPLSLDVYEKDGALHVTAPVPGLELADIKITVHDDVLTIAGERKEEKEVKEKNYYLKESSSGYLRRSIRLPADARADQASASLDKGVLHVTMPKNGIAKPKTIEVKVT